MSKGMPAKSVKLKKLEGTYREDRYVSNSMQPERVDGIPDPPQTLRNGAKIIWTDQVVELQKINSLYGIDLNMLASYCNEMATYFSQKEKIYREGYLIENRFKEEVVNPRVKISNDALDRALRIAKEFGFTPQSRVKLALPEVRDVEDSLTVILNRKKKPQQNK